MIDGLKLALRHTEVARARRLIGEIHVPYQPQLDLKVALDELRYTALETRGHPQRGLHLFGPSYAGKSSAARQYAAEVAAMDDQSSGAVPIAVTTIDPDGSLAAVASDILRALGEPKPAHGSAALRWERVWDCIPERRVQVLVLDEFQRAGRRTSVSPVIAGKVQDLMEGGLCAVAFLGLEHAGEILRAAPDLPNRLDAPVTMPALIWADEYDRALFRSFVNGFDEALVEKAVLPLRSGLADHLDQLQLLHEACNGLIGQCARLIETAAVSVVRDQHSCITAQDLTDAVDDWAIPNGRINYNPYRN